MGGDKKGFRPCEDARLDEKLDEEMLDTHGEKKVKATIRIVAAVLTAFALLSVPAMPALKAVVNMNLLMLIPLDEILVIRERPKPKPKPLPVNQSRKAPRSLPSPVIAPTEMQAAPSPIVVAEPSMEKPEFGPIHEIFDDPPDDRPPVKLDPKASPLPDIVMRETVTDEARPPAGIPANIKQRGEVFKGSGAPELEPATIASYTGPNLDFPETDKPTIGLSRGDEVATTTDVPGTARGEKYKSAVGKAPGPGKANSMLPSEDMIGEDELAGLLNWLRSHPGQFPQVLQSYMETDYKHLKGVARFGGWDIFIQFSEDEHQLKLFMSQGTNGILLADSDFKRRSQLFGMGLVNRSGQQLTAITAKREKPTLDNTHQFYAVFQGWMQSQGISLGERAER